MLAAVWFAFVTTGAFASTENVTDSRDTLVFKDGDRLHGVVVQQSAEAIVFRSDRFGELRVKPTDAVVIPAEKGTAAAAPKPATPAPPRVASPAPAVAAKTQPAVAAPAPTPVAATPEARREAAEVERATVWDRFTPSVLTARVRRLFGPWKGRFAFSTEIVSDVAERLNHSVEARVTRKWERDELQVNTRYDLAETNGIRTTDMVKAAGSWRREFSKAHFAHYRPSVEWNRASRRQGVPNEYVLLQQEIGAGFNLLNSPTRKVRTGVSQNLFDIWNSAPVPDHTSRTTPSSFQELEFKLPWQMGLTQRGVWYPVRHRRDGWENRIELNKKLTETLSTSVRHEVRRHNPDGSAQNYERLRLMFALDF